MAGYDTASENLQPSAEILVAVLSPQDPYYASGVSGIELAGPILSVLQVCPFAKVVLVCPHQGGEDGHTCAEAIQQRHDAITVERVTLPPADLGDPETLRDVVANLLPKLGRNHGVAYLAAGAYPHLHSVFLAFLAEDRFVARLIDVSRPSLPSGQIPVVRTLLNPFRPSAMDSAPTVREPGAVYVHRRSPGQDGTDAPARPGRQSAQEPDVETVAASLGFVSEHPAMQTLLETVGAVAQHQVPILIQGETGTGKGMCARLVHALSPMRSGPFVAVNCGALPEQLIESQLFGHREGAFTGAVRDQAGKFEQAHGGTLFLDEIGELPLALQPKLLRVLEDGVVEPLGATKGRTVNVRILAATNRDLRGAVARREFREDLYYRLAFAVVPIPALRDRRSDIPGLALQFLARINASMKDPRRLSPAALDRLSRMSWQGNVRDLENVIGRSVLLSSARELDAEDLVIEEAPALAMDSLAAPRLGEGFDLETHLSEVRRALVEQALAATDGNQRAAARLLGISRQAVSRFARETREKNDA